jgi:hypothetical protein
VGLDGVWDVRRVSGFLPPLVGVRKRIHGARGLTTLGPLRVPFEVRDREFHYRGPFRGFVDVVEIVEPDRARGRATFRGREFARFELRRSATS